MIREVYVSEETVALAKLKACEMLGVSEDKIEFEVLQYPSKKVFGMFGGKQAQIKAQVKQTKAEKAVEFLKDVFFYMGIENINMKIEEENPKYCDIIINTDKIKYIVGKHGETLDSLQYLAGIAVNDRNDPENFCKIRLEAGNYREIRKKTLEKIGKGYAKKAIKINKRVDMEPMRSYERKVIHDTIRKMAGVKSWSEGDAGNRHVVICPAPDKVRDIKN